LFIFAGIDDLREKREEVLKTLRDDEAEKAKIQSELQSLTKRLANLNDSISKKVGQLTCGWRNFVASPGCTA
jgi:hypothetical protein